MKTTSRILLFALLALATELILSCAPPPVTIDDRVSMFITSLNGSRTDTYTNCDPNASQYAAAKAASFWNALFAQPGPYSAAGVNTSNSAAVTLTIYWSGGSGAYTFAMVNDRSAGSDNWLISKITDPSPTVVFQ